MSIISSAAHAGFTKKGSLFVPDLTADYPNASNIKHRSRTSTMAQGNGILIDVFPDEVSGNHWIQTTEANRPPMSKPQNGALGALSFSAGKRMTTQSAMPEYPAMTVLMAVKSATTSGGYILQMGNDARGITQAFSSGNYSYYNGSTHTVMQGGGMSTTAFKSRITTNCVSWTSSFWILGSAAGGAAPYPGYLLDIMIWDIVLDLTARNAALAKMNAHYSLTA